jgi:hypothetical protein
MQYFIFAFVIDNANAAGKSNISKYILKNDEASTLFL